MCDRCSKHRDTARAAAGIAPYHRHSQLVQEQCIVRRAKQLAAEAERREALQRIREKAGRSPVESSEPVWLSCLLIALIVFVAIFGRGLLP